MATASRFTLDAKDAELVQRLLRSAVADYAAQADAPAVDQPTLDHVLSTVLQVLNCIPVTGASSRSTMAELPTTTAATSEQVPQEAGEAPSSSEQPQGEAGAAPAAAEAGPSAASVQGLQQEQQQQMQEEAPHVEPGVLDLCAQVDAAAARVAALRKAVPTEVAEALAGQLAALRPALAALDVAAAAATPGKLVRDLTPVKAAPDAAGGPAAAELAAASSTLAEASSQLPRLRARLEAAVERLGRVLAVVEAEQARPPPRTMERALKAQAGGAGGASPGRPRPPLSPLPMLSHHWRRGHGQRPRQHGAGRGRRGAVGGGHPGT